MNNDYRLPACLVSFYVTRNTFTINIGLMYGNGYIYQDARLREANGKQSSKLQGTNQVVECLFQWPKFLIIVTDGSAGHILAAVHCKNKGG